MEHYNPTADWEKLNDVNYRKTELYESMAWDVSLDSFAGVGARFGGPLAITAGPQADKAAHGQVKPTFRFFNNAGHAMR